MGKILISSCLLGFNTRFNGGNKFNESLAANAQRPNIVFACPEQLGGLPTPRPATEIEYGMTAKDVFDGNARVLTVLGEDQTALYIRAAEETLLMCQKIGVVIAVLYSKSPSCGSQNIYDGTFTGNTISGEGLVAFLLSKNGIKVYDETNYPKELFV